MCCCIHTLESYVHSVSLHIYALQTIEVESWKVKATEARKAVIDASHEMAQSHSECDRRAQENRLEIEGLKRELAVSAAEK